MKENLKKIKEKLELAFEEPNKKDLLIGQALGLIDSLIDRINNEETNSTIPVPNMIWQHTNKPNFETMNEAVDRHKELHKKMSSDSISQKNTQFEQLK